MALYKIKIRVLGLLTVKFLRIFLNLTSLLLPI